MSTWTLVPTVLCTMWAVLGTAALVDVTASTDDDVDPKELPGVSVLKPLCGADPGLEENLASFFLQDHPRYEILFGVEDAEDPALAVVKRLQQRFPEVRATLIVHTNSDGTNPKVRNLRAMLPHALHDLVLISDSNVRASSDYVSRAVASKIANPHVGLVTHMFVGRGGRGLGAQLESIDLAGFCAPGVALPHCTGDVAVIGKSMLLSQAELEHVGGIARVADVLAEDYLLGKMYQHAGYSVVLSPVVLQNSLGKMSLRAFVERHLRWAMMRIRLRPFAYLLEPVTSPLAMLPFAWHCLGPMALLWAIAVLCIRDVVSSYTLQGTTEIHRPILWGWLREIVSLYIWVVAPFRRHVSWRGHKVRVGAGTMLFTHESLRRRKYAVY
jgi:ceramide glucosyltransferase